MRLLGAARSSVVEIVGRALLVFAPVVTANAVVGHRGLGQLAASALATGLVWFVAINIGLAASTVTVEALGPGLGVVRGVAAGLISTTVLGVWIPGVALEPRIELALASVIFVLIVGWQRFVLAYLIGPVRLMLIGPSRGCAEVLREITGHPAKRFEVVGIVESGGAGVGSQPGGRAANDLSRIVSAERPELIALVPGCDRPAIFAQLPELAASGFRVLELAHFYEYAFGRVPVRDLPQAWFMSVLHLYQRRYSRFAKRAFDISVAIVILVLVAPLLPLLALLVRSTPGPMIIRQVRLGEYGRPFTIYKFRTMRHDAEQPGEAVWAVVDDPRVTSIGRVLRRLRLDELPQIWNVLTGEMSVVGPRPERPEIIDELIDSVPFWTRRHLVKPGITGWAQVNRGYVANSEGSLEKLSLDLWYIRHRGLAIDLLICFRTLAAVLRGEHPALARSPMDAFEPLTLVPSASVSHLEIESIPGGF